MKKSLGKPIATRKKSRTKIHKNWFFTLPLFALGQKISEANYLVLISSKSPTKSTFLTLTFELSSKYRVFILPILETRELFPSYFERVEGKKNWVWDFWDFWDLIWFMIIVVHLWANDSLCIDNSAWRFRKQYSTYGHFTCATWTRSGTRGIN